MMKRLHFGSRGIDMINKNKNNFCIVSGWGGGGEGLKPNIMILKGAIVTYI